MYNKFYQVLQVLHVRVHLRFNCLVVFPLRSLTSPVAMIVAVQLYNKNREDPCLEALREQEVHRQQAIESLSKWSQHI